MNYRKLANAVATLLSYFLGGSVIGGMHVSTGSKAVFNPTPEAMAPVADARTAAQESGNTSASITVNGPARTIMVEPRMTLLDALADLSDAEIRERMSGNLCRCACYPNIVDGPSQCVVLSSSAAPPT
jgi:hypothetical protein